MSEGLVHSSDKDKPLKRRRWLYLPVFASVSRLAHAHGEEVLLSIFAELASIALCIALLLIWRRAKPYRVLGAVACMLALVVENWAVSGVSYRQHRNLITIAGFIVPIAATVLAICVSQRIANYKK
jgi:hypothetical protein